IRGLEPTPYFSALWTSQLRRPSLIPVLVGFVVGVVCGVLLVGAIRAIQLFLPGTLPRTLHPPGIAAALVASAAGSLGEEIVFRLFALSCLLRLLPDGRGARSLALAVSALAFAAAHAPAAMFLFGGWQEVPLVSWVWVVGLNGLLGLAFGWV